MANEEHLRILEQGVEIWNQWRKNNPQILPDLSEAHLSEENLSGIYFYKANLFLAHLSGADLSGAHLSGADLSGADLRGATLRGAVLDGADLRGADFSGADLREANLNSAILVVTDLSDADLTHCQVYGISVWDIELDGSKQLNLVITPEDEPTITVDNLEVAQFIYLLLNNEKIRGVIDTITGKAVLILGRFTPERKVILDAIREKLRQLNYLPILFDFDKPSSRDLTETIRTLAHMSRFIIADITEPRSIPQELQAIVPDLAIPVQPLLLKGSTGEYAMFQDLRRKYHWVLTTYKYSDLQDLLSGLDDKVIAPAEAKAVKLQRRRK